MSETIFRSLMKKNYGKIHKRQGRVSGYVDIEVNGMGMRKGFEGFFGGLPFSPWGAGMKPWGWQKEFGGQIVESTPSGAFRINPGVPLYSGDTYNTSFWPYQPNKPPKQSMEYLKHKMYETAWKLGRVKNVTPQMKERFQGDLDFMINSLKQMYPFDCSNSFSKIRKSVNNAFKTSSGNTINKGLMDAIYELDYWNRRVGYMNISPFQR